MKVIFAKYNRERKARFQTETTIFLEGGLPIVRKRGLTPEAALHIRAIYDNYHVLKQNYRNVSISNAKLIREEIIFEYMRGRSLGSILIDAVMRRNKEAFLSLISRYVDFLKDLEIGQNKKMKANEKFLEIFGQAFEFQNLECLELANLDLTFENIILDLQGNYSIIDYEWVFEFSIPVDFIMYRSLNRFYFKYREYLDKFITKNEIFRFVNIDTTKATIFERMEESFQEYVYGKCGRDRTCFVSGNYLKNVRPMAELESLAEANQRLREIEFIQSGHGWRLLTKYFKLRDKLLPVGTRRRIIAKILFSLPGLITKEKIRKSINYLRARGPKEFCRKVKEELRISPLHRSIYSGKSFAPEKCKPYETYIKNNEIHSHIRTLLSDTSRQFKYKPLISIVLPVYNVEPRWLRAAVDSVLQQIYWNWELCIADDASTNKATLEVLEKYESSDKRIKVVFRKENGHICAASNSAADLAQGEFVAFMDNDDVVAPNALFEIVRVLQKDSECDMIYSDEDKIEENDKRYDPHFKPDWSPELFLSYNYINHLTCIRRSLFESVGRFRIGFEGAQDYDLLLRIIEKTDRIRHIPKILYHWRAIRGSVALEAKDKPIMQISAQKGIKDHLRRKGIQARIYQPEFAKSMGLPIYQLDWPDRGPSVTIIIPTFNQYALLKKCIESIVNLSTYLNYEIMIVDNGSNDKKTLDYLETVRKKGIRVERIENDGQPFSFSRINNLAVQKVNTEYILFLNNDIEVLQPKWLSRLVGYLNLPGVGGVGAKLLYPNNTLQHAGVVLGMHDGIIPDHAFIKHPSGIISYYFMAEVSRNCSAVTGACLMTRRSDFIGNGGFDERDFKVSLQDVDYCLRLAKKSLRTVYVGGAELIHHTSMSRPQEDSPDELAHLRKIYAANRDLYYNPNLSKTNSFAPDTGCTLTDYGEYLTAPLKVMIFSHNLELAGAPKAMYDLATGLKTESSGRIMCKIVSPVAGPLQSLYDRAGIKHQIIDIKTKNLAAGWEKRAEYETAIENARNLLEEEKPDILITNTVYGFYAIQAARPRNLPVIWIISETLNSRELRSSIKDFVLQECITSFAQAYCVVFGSTGTRNCYDALNSRHNFQVIHNSIDGMAVEQFIKDVKKEEARRYLGIPSDKRILLMVGTICERKGQETLAKAVAYLKEIRKDFCCYMVGANEKFAGPYLQKIRGIVKRNKLDEFIKILPETKELYWYYLASDIFVFTSKQECYPLATLEAMAFGLPIVTTPCCGVTEQVRSINALFFNPSDGRGLAKQLSVLLSDEEKIRYLGRNSRAISEYQQTYQEMIEKYKNLVFGAWIKGNYPE
jgi:GT2 family glycosyltransferase/glycosyltransferase involved in cell wall biosynthesis